MSVELGLKLARSLMYEGYVLYPYRQSSLKNQKRLIFGSLYPSVQAESSGERAGATATVLLAAETLLVRLLLLQWGSRGDSTWLEAQERCLVWGPLQLSTLASAAQVLEFSLPGSEGELSTLPLQGVLRVSARSVAGGVFELSLAVSNHSLASEASERTSFGAAHLLLHTEQGSFVSLLEPPEALASAARACKNDGWWPVLVGDAESRRTVLASPITLYDFPLVAPESPGDYCDATEIDEMLALRVRTLTDAEKAEARRTDPRARQILERSEGLSDEQLLGLHGAWRAPPQSGGGPKPGDRVRLRPKSGRDVFDLALAGELATVISLEQDLEGRHYCTVTVDADPGRDLGALGQPGHRFFFELEEVEPAT